MRLKALVIALLLGWTVAAVAQEAKPATPPAEAPAAPTTPAAAPSAPAAAAAAPQFKFEMHGFASGSGYVQDGTTGLSEGQQAIFSTPSPGKHDRAFTGFDVRQSRFNFSVAGPKVFDGATPKAVLEIDFFGGYGAGALGNASLVPRLRLAYAELNWGANRIAFGQQNDLIFAMAPTSLAHIAFPFGYMAGNIGWRRPGIWGFHTFAAGGPKLEFAWEIARSTWNDAAVGIGASTVNPAAAPGGVSLGEASGMPAFEARLTLSQGTAWSAFVTGHWNRVDGSGIGASGGVGNLDTVAVNAGAKVVAGPLTVAATAYTGKNLTPLVANFVQFQPSTAFINIHEKGGWVQAGFNFTKELSLWYFLGAAAPNQDENRKVADANAEIARAAARTASTVGPSYQFHNTTNAAMLQYRDGGYAIGLEWINFNTRNARYTYAGGTAATAPTSVTFSHTESVKTNQVMLSGNYFF